MGDVLEFIQDFERGGILVAKDNTKNSFKHEEVPTILIENLRMPQEQIDKDDIYDDEDDEQIDNWGTLV